MTARTITTYAELDALPVGSVVRGAEFEYGPAATIYVRQEEFWYPGWGVDEEAYFDLPVVVLHDPSAPVVPVVSDAAVEAAARALADDWNPGRDPVLTAMFRDYAATAVAAALPFLGAAPSATREDVDLTAAIAGVWDDGNAVGLDGWTGPERGSDEVDDYAVRARERAVRRALDAIAPRTDR